jgi:hydrogenase nickel incorporation protein HypA/HybF
MAEPMHELAVTESLLEIALRHAREQHAHHITDLYLVIGQWSSMVDDSIQFYWDILSEGTMAKGAILHFKRIPVILICQNCGEEYHPDSQEFTCPKCGGTQTQVKTGQEFQLEAIDVEEDNPAGNA